MARQCILGIIPLLVCIGPTARADGKKPSDYVMLRSGKILAGTVVGFAKVEAGSMYRVSTDFGELLVPKKAVKDKVRDKAPDKDATFAIRRVKVVRIAGDVKRLSKGAEVWQSISWSDKYADQVTNQPNALVKPGDAVRTGPDGQIDIMPHKDVWIRIVSNSEVLIPEEDPPKTDGSLTVRRGSTVQKITGRPRGQIYRVRTPLTLLAARDTSFFRLSVGAKDSVAVAQGKVTMGKRTVRAGKEVVLDANGGFDTCEMTDASRKALEARVLRIPVDDMVYVPGGTYTLGGTSGTLGTTSYTPLSSTYAVGEHPQVTIAGFLIDRREVTNAEYADFVEAMGVAAPKSFPDGKLSASLAKAPVYGVDWDSARRFARWCGRALPLEAQWEVAARGPKSRLLPWGTSMADKHMSLRKGEFFNDGTWIPPRDLTPVDEETVDVSWYGVRAMVSGVPEWCRDWYARRPFVDGVVEGPKEGTQRVVRGWSGATRHRHPMDPKARKGAPGIRLVIDLEPQPR